MDREPPPPAIADDKKFRELEEKYRKAVVKVFCPTRRSGGNYAWTGFVVNRKPCIILTVSHPVKLKFTVVDVQGLFYVNFYEEAANYPVVAVGCSLCRDLLVLYCENAPSPPFFQFPNPIPSNLNSTTFFSISHPDKRDWSMLRGRICRGPFKIGENEAYSPDLEIFDHDASLYPGASGAALIDLSGELIGIQLTQRSRKLRSLCVKNPILSAYDEVTSKNFDTLSWEVKELSLLTCDLRQAHSIQGISDSLREMFPREPSDPLTTDLNIFLRNSVIRHLRRRHPGGSRGSRGSSGQRSQPPEPSRGSSSGKRPWQQSILQSITDGNPRILHRHVEAADYISKVEAASLKLNKRTAQSEELSSVELLSHAATKNILQAYNGALVPNTDQAFRLNELTCERRQDVGGAKVVVDANTGRPKGNGFVRFGDENEKFRAMAEMNGQYCSRPFSMGVATPKKPPQQQYSLQVGDSAYSALTRGSQSYDDTSNTTAFSDALYVTNGSQCGSGLSKSQMDNFDLVKTGGDDLRLLEVELEAVNKDLEAEKLKTAAKLHNQLVGIAYKAMVKC